MKYLKKIGANAKKAFLNLNKINHKKTVTVLETYNKKLLKNKKQIIKENFKDLKNIKRKHLIDRLVIDEKKIEEIRHSIDNIAKFKNPIGRTLSQWTRPNKLKIKKVTIPIGVIGVIYESRPNVTADVAALCFKSGNCSILRGGSEAFCSNTIIAGLFRDALKDNSIDENCLQFIKKKDRKIVDYLLGNMTEFIDVIVPRGGKNLVKKVNKFSGVPVIGHLAGLCHIYVDKNYDVLNACKVVVNAKMRRTSICGAAETILINSECIKSHAIPIINALISAGCSVVVDKKINSFFKKKFPLARESDWKTEYLSAKISIKSVSGVTEAISHIIKYGTMHTDSISTNNKKNAELFVNGVNSSIAMINTSTQFADGGEFGFGGEIGISTNKLPPRGPVGIEQLTSYKYIVLGKGTVRS